MWVRSQDKTILKKVNDIRLEIINVDTNGMKTKQYLIVWDGWQCFNERCLGEYSTKEKAFKALDMLQEWLTPKMIVKPIHKRYEYDIRANRALPIDDEQETITAMPLAVFQMPSDEEVK